MYSNTTVSHEMYLMTIYNEQLHVSACAAEHTPTIASFSCICFVLCCLIPGFIFCFTNKARM